MLAIVFHGILENKVTFLADELGLHPEFATLSLLQVTKSFVCIGTVGTSRSYRFLHLSIQELLAAWHISKMYVQLDLVRGMLHHHQFGEIFQFYAGITKLQTPGIEGLVRSIYCLGLQGLFIYDLMSKISIVWLLNCLYEMHE